MMTPEEELISRSNCDGEELIGEDDIDSSLPALEWPRLAEAEHRWIEGRLGRSLTNEEAQLALREATLQAAWEHWLAGRGNHNE